MLRLEIATDNAAFDDERRGPELARILRDLAQRIERLPPDEGVDWAVFDINGNRVGRLDLEARD